MKVAFCGMGRMGRAMARHLLEAGHDLTIWNRTPGRAGELVSAGAQEAATPAQASAGAEVVVLMLFGPEAVREVLLGGDGVVAGSSAGTLVIDATTIGPTAAREFGSALAERGLRYVDAPVAGSVAPATEGTLGVLAGGSDADYADAEPLLRLWGDPERVRRVGEVGAGNAAKLVVNQALGIAVTGLGEALRLAAGLDVERGLVLDLLESGPYGFTIKQKRTMLERADYSSATFSAELMAKDLDLVLAESRDELRVTAAAATEARAAVEAGHGSDDYAAIAGFLADHRS